MAPTHPEAAPLVPAAVTSPMAGASHPTSTLVSVRSWEVEAPPPINTVKGALVPRMLTRRRGRKVSIEVHRIEKQQNGHNFSYEECIVRLLSPMKKVKAKRASRDDDDNENANYNDDDDDDNSTVMPSLARDISTSNFATPDYHGWKEKYRMLVGNVVIKGTHRNAVFIQATIGSLKQTRQFIFNTIEAADEFCTVLREESENGTQRSQNKLDAALDGVKISQKGEVTFLFEMVSAWDLPIGDITSSDPYAVCKFNGSTVHKTQHISNTLDPIWTISTGSLFLFTVHPEELFLSEGLLVIIKDYDAFSSNEELGCFYIPPSLIYDAKGERWEFKLLPGHGSNKTEVPGYVAMKCRRATEYDIKFVKDHINKSLKTGGGLNVAMIGDHKGGVNMLSSYFRRQTRMKEGIREYKIRPGPDPDRVEETTWMSREQIETETLKESHHWFEIAGGQLGRVFVEILGCDGLPNLDTGGRNKTDSFVAMVYEDAVVKTDVIDDCLNPRWLPWMKRAAIFSIHHSSSSLYLGVFDFDQSMNPADDHDLIGRVAVDLANLRSDTIYVLKYDIWTTAKISDRKRMGSIKLRLRKEIDDERLVLMSTLQAPPDFYVNAKTRKDYRLIHFACNGKYDTTKYSIDYINSYIEEILLYQHIQYYLKDAFMSLLLWRGTFPLTVFGEKVMIPVHSFAIFVSLAVVVERPQLAPAWFFGAIGWIMLAMMDFRVHGPNPWLRCKDFGEFVVALATGASPNPPASILQNENAEEAEAFVERMKKRILDAEAAAAQEYEENAKAQEKLDQMLGDVPDVTDISTSRKDGGFSIDPFKSVLFPVQQNLATICKYLRLVGWIVYWEECYVSFWFTLGCFVISAVFICVPWFFLLKWSSRLVVWVVLGPWMKLADIYYFSKENELTEETMDQRKLEAREKRLKAHAATLSEMRIKREKALKLQAMKKYMFGKYIARIPLFKEDRFKDIPLSESYAVPYNPTPLPLSEIAMQEAGYHRTRLAGQNLVGDMIPVLEEVNFTAAPVGQPIKQRRLVDRNAPAGNIFIGVESTTQAYIKIGSLALLAAFITWFVVPFFSSLVDYVIGSRQTN